MTMDIQTEMQIGGGPVAPIAEPTGATLHSLGMTMRQHYASVALAGLLSNEASRCHATDHDKDALATQAFAIADCMISAEGGA